MTTEMHNPDDDTPETLNPRRAMLAGIGLAAGALLASTANAGPLTPPAGAISSTPGPEPRIPINSINTPGSPGTFSVFRITVPGSYYLTGNIESKTINRHVIVIAADRVTIDLNGFTVSGLGVQQGAFDCIFAESGFECITVKNGFVELAGRSGVNLHARAGCAVEGVSVRGGGFSGIRVGAGSRVTDCMAIGTSATGISAGYGCTITNCITRSNAFHGIDALGGCTIAICTSDSNYVGIRASPSCTITNCTSHSNSTIGIEASSGGTITNCTSHSNSGAGIITYNFGTVTNCVTNANSYGIWLGADCFVRHNICDTNVNSGIHITNSDNRVEDNNCTDNLIGINCTASGNFIARNTCSGNTTNWNIVASNKCLVVNGTNADAIIGNSGGLSPGSTNPNANYTF